MVNNKTFDTSVSDVITLGSSNIVISFAKSLTKTHRNLEYYTNFIFFCFSLKQSSQFLTYSKVHIFFLHKMKQLILFLALALLVNIVVGRAVSKKKEEEEKDKAPPNPGDGIEEVSEIAIYFVE